MTKPTQHLKLEFAGLDEAPIVFADNFMLASRNRVLSLYLCQDELGNVLAEKKGLHTERRTPTRTKCVLRVVFPEETTVKLLRALAENRGLSIQEKETAVEPVVID